MTINAPSATGIFKQVRICPETTYGTAPAASSTSAQIIRRVSSDVSLGKATYRSNEIQPDRQIHDMRHGIRNVRGTLRGELSPLTFEAVMAAALNGSFTTGATASALTVTAVAAVVSTSPGTFTRSAGSWITDGFKLGDIVNFSGFTSGAAANNARNYRITALTATVMSVGPTPTASVGVGNEAVVAAASAPSISCNVVGKKLINPAAGSLVDASFSLEHWFSDIAQGELFVGCKPSQMAFSLPPTGLATLDVTWEGQNLSQTGTAQYFTAAQAVTTTTVAASVDGLLLIGGLPMVTVTGLSFSVNGNLTVEPVVGNNITPFVYNGILDVSGQFTALFADNVLRDHFINEDEIALQASLFSNNTVNSNFLNFFFPRIKLTSAPKNDTPNAIVQTFGFQALNQINGGAATNQDATTIMIQDSQAT